MTQDIDIEAIALKTINWFEDNVSGDAIFVANESVIELFKHFIAAVDAKRAELNPPVATTCFQDPEDERIGVRFSTQDWNVLAKLPPNTRMFTYPPAPRISESGETFPYELDLRERIVELESECMEQARLNGMGSEREARLESRVRELERQRAQGEAPQSTVPDGWKPTEKEILEYGRGDGQFGLFADEGDALAIANGVLELVQLNINKLNAAPTYKEKEE